MAELSTIYTAAELDAAAQHDMEQRFSQKLGHDVHFNFLVDESLIGGFLALIDGRAYDNSLKTRLDNMRKYILNEGE